MKKTFLVACIASVAYAADEKPVPKPVDPPKITADEKLAVKEVENEIFRLRLDMAAAKERESKMVENYTKMIQPLYVRCQEKAMVLNEKMDCVPAPAAPAPVPAPKK